MIRNQWNSVGLPSHPGIILSQNSNYIRVDSQRNLKLFSGLGKNRIDFYDSKILGYVNNKSQTNKIAE